MSVAAAAAQNINAANPAANDPVSERRYPNAYGPAKPTALASALIIPTETAAVESRKISVGIAQKTGKNAGSTQIRLKDETIIIVELGRPIKLRWCGRDSW